MHRWGRRPPPQPAQRSEGGPAAQRYGDEGDHLVVVPLLLAGAALLGRHVVGAGAYLAGAGPDEVDAEEVLCAARRLESRAHDGLVDVSSVHHAQARHVLLELRFAHHRLPAAISQLGLWRRGVPQRRNFCLCAVAEQHQLRVVGAAEVPSSGCSGQHDNNSSSNNTVQHHNTTQHWKHCTAQDSRAQRNAPQRNTTHDNTTTQ